MRSTIILLLTLVTINYSCKNSGQSEKLAEAPQITFISAQQDDVPIYIEQVGQLYGQKDIPIRARVDGFLEEIAFEEGSKVKKGQLLYRIDDSQYQERVAAQQSRVSEAQTRLTNAKNELDRYKPLAEINAVSQSDLDAAQANYESAQASVSAAQANLEASRINLSYCRILSPINGFIGKTEARVGEYVGQSPNPVILNTVSKTDTVRVEFTISESVYLELAKKYQLESKEPGGKSTRENIEQQVQLILADGSVYPEKGKVDFVNSVIDPTTGSILIQASFPNPTRLLRPGLYAKVRILQHTENDAILIPERCIIELQGKFFVYLINEKNEVENRSIKRGYRSGDLRLISQGLKKGDKVIIDALQKVQPGSQVQPVESEFKSKTPA